jgi:hypothetical protein
MNSQALFPGNVNVDSGNILSATSTAKVSEKTSTVEVIVLTWAFHVQKGLN